LLRSCPDVSKIFIMMRSKKNKSASTRLDEIFKSPLFSRVKKEMPNFREKIVPVVGELYEADLGFTKGDTDLLTHEISIIFHLGASIRFNNDIKSATTLNVVATRAMLNLAKRMPNLKSFIYVSTAYANCQVKHVEERVYKYLINPEELITLVQTSSENMINETLSGIISQWPNSYTFTKAMAEMVVKVNGERLPIGIFRPSIVTNVAHEPLVGWGDNYYTMMGFIAPISKGLLRFVMCNSDCNASVVPVDITINALIASAWDVFNQPQRRGDKMLIYNNVSTNDAPLTYGDFFFYSQISCQKYPIKSCYWMPTLTTIRNKVIFAICIWFGHLLPALIIDTFGRCIGIRQRMWKSYKQIHDFCKAVEYFTVREWTFTDNNIHAIWQSMSESDQLLFNFNMKGFNWPQYWDNTVKGVHHYLLKEDLSTLEASRIKSKRLYWIHYATKFAFILIVVVFTCNLLANIFL
ncbi:PREDICTED: putative fatty acyl-CoA reductase CG5065, partial [Dinoponera quadriceps]|uniref:Fatty acyl-CoA reductase n=1 Tax=Dinoponera quadriceps TaxID=609295 RepID=A0A6P3Y795_DINQU